jgi:hypothetical protein
VAQRRNLSGDVGRFEAMFVCSRGDRGEAEIGGPMLWELGRKGVEMADAGSLHSRRRMVTAGAGDPLPIVRLPERNPLRNNTLFGEFRKCLQG